MQGHTTAVTAEPIEPGRPAIVPFDRHSLLWQVMADTRSGLWGPAAAALQGAHPIVAAGVLEHSTVFADPVGRAWRSGDAVLRWVFGGERALDEARVLREIHKEVQGVGYDGERYHALQAEPFAWVWATGWLPAINGLRRFWDEPVTRALEEQLYEEFKNLGRILGVRERCIPATLDDFEAYWDAMLVELAAGHAGMPDGVSLFARPPRPHRFVPRVLWRPISVASGRPMCFLLGPEAHPRCAHCSRHTPATSGPLDASAPARDSSTPCVWPMSCRGRCAACPSTSWSVSPVAAGS